MFLILHEVFCRAQKQHLLTAGKALMTEYRNYSTNLVNE